MTTTYNRQQRPGRRLLRLAGVVLLLWVIYKGASTRIIPTAMRVDDSCATYPATAADMTLFDPGAAPIPCRSWNIGTGVTGYVWEASNPRAVLLLTHGYGDYAQRYVQQNNQLIPHLLNVGVSVYAFDMWGSGRSPGSRGMTDGEQAARDTLAARQLLADTELPVFLLGHSYGGLITVTSALRDQSGLSGVILLAPDFVYYDPGPFWRGVAQVGGFLFPTFIPSLGFSDNSELTRDRDALQRIQEDPLMHMGGMTFVTVRDRARIAYENQALYPQLRVPILVVHGTGDGIASSNGSRDFIAAVASEDKTLALIEDGHHSLLDDWAQDEARGLILAWLEERLPAP